MKITKLTKTQNNNNKQAHKKKNRNYLVGK